MTEFHGSLCGGHHFWRTTTYKILRPGYFWPLDMLELYEKTIDKSRHMDKRSLPLHRKLKNVYKHNRACQTEIRKLKAELQSFKEKVAKRNFGYIG
jgi:hypothetical protein